MSELSPSPRAPLWSVRRHCTARGGEEGGVQWHFQIQCTIEIFIWGNTVLTVWANLFLHDTVIAVGGRGTRAPASCLEIISAERWLVVLEIGLPCLVARGRKRVLIFFFAFLCLFKTAPSPLQPNTEWQVSGAGKALMSWIHNTLSKPGT